MGKKKHKKRPDREAGWIHFDIFNLSVPLYLTEDDRVASLEYDGFTDVTRVNSKYYGLVTKNYGPKGFGFSVVITAEAEPMTWAHEATHLADLVMNTFGIPLGVKNTEIRAYLVGHTFKGISDILGDLLKTKKKLH